LPGDLVLPGLGVLLALAVGLVGIYPRIVLGLLGASAVLAAAGLALVPDAWNPARPEGAIAVVEGARPLAMRRKVDGLRPGAGVRVERSPLADGPGPWYEPATEGEAPARGPWVIVLDGRTGELRPQPTGVFVPGVRVTFENALDLDAFDAAVVLPGAWGWGDPKARDKADAIAEFVRRGGLLLGPGPEHEWPEPLPRRLGPAGQGTETGAAAARRLGLGRVVRAGSEEEALDVIASGLWAPEVGTVFDRATSAPPTPEALPPWEDEPRRRRPEGWILLGYALLVGAFDAVRRGPLVRALGFLGPAAAATVGLLLAAPGAAAVRVDGVVLDLGGAGGRRVEAACVRAGPAGFEGRVLWRGGGIVRMLGGERTEGGRVRLEPGETAWTVRETTATGRPGEGDREDRRAGFLRGLLVGRSASERLRFGRGAVLPLEVEGIGAVEAWTLLLRVGREPP
jgi:hypothetical protein